MEYALFKNRSYRGIISKGFGLYFSHFRLFFKASWLMAIIYAFVFAALEMLLSVKLPALSATIMKQEIVLKMELSQDVAQQYLITIGSVCLLIILYVVVKALTSATILNKLKEHQDSAKMTMPTHWFRICRKLMGRTLKGTVFTIVVVLIPLVLIVALLLAIHYMMPAATMALHITTGVCCIALGLMSVPLVYVFMKYVMRPDKSYFSMLGSAYATGLRHWGQIFSSCLIVTIIVCTLAAVFCLPTIILAQAHWISQEGFLNGDPLGMPGYINILSACTFFVTGFLLVYLYIPILMTCYYLYGSIETYEQEKNKLDV